MSDERLFQLAVDAPLLNVLTYKSANDFVRGTSVHVPLGKRKARAVILNSASTAGEYELKNIESLDETRPRLSDIHVRFLEWLAEYYVHPIGQVMALSFPPLDTKESKRKSKKPPVVKQEAPSIRPDLTPDQKEAVSAIASKPGFHAHLLFGVTGSGKTEVYLHALEKILAEGKTGLVLVPEISLTPQLIGRFSARFGDSIAVLHSHLTDRERTGQWWSIVSGEKKILIGARSALFCPMDNLGLIIVDEEHEASYKQDEKLKYNGRDAAIMLAKLHNIPVVLGSATPSMESWNNAVTGKYQLHRMSSRVGGRALPSVQIVDLRESRRKRKDEGTQTELPFWISNELYDLTVEALNRKEQVAFFLNRRGIAQTVLCSDCGYSYRCPNCEISLTLHGKNHLVCHYCDYSSTMHETCPSCKEGEPKPLGLGTEQIEEDLKKLFPEARIARADRDEIQNRESLEDLISQMENRQIDLLVGTQMIAKGLDFPHLTVVGLVLADVGFNLPDFRSTERSFQLVTQVSGRAGRHILKGGHVVVQTYNPDHVSLKYAKLADFEGFAKEELEARAALHYPPSGKIAAFRISGSEQSLCENTCDHLAQRAKLLCQKNPQYGDIKILGPAPAPLMKIRGKYRYHLLLKALKPQVLSPFCRQLLGDESWIPASTKVQVDIDPLHLL